MCIPPEAARSVKEDDLPQQRRTVVKGLENKSCEEQLRELE